VICEDRELLANLYRLNAALASLALRIMDGSASAAEQLDYAQRLIRAGEQLQQRATRMNGAVFEGSVIIPIPLYAVESTGECEHSS
jgi:hypothetical protein